MTFTVDGEPIPVCPVCGRAQPWERGRFRAHNNHHDNDIMCVVSGECPIGAAMLASEQTEIP
jgi:hypothetical protein